MICYKQVKSGLAHSQVRAAQAFADNKADILISLVKSSAQVYSNIFGGTVHLNIEIENIKQVRLPTTC